MSAALRLLPSGVADGGPNMAADEALLGAAARGVASLRFYGWSAPTLSLGYFQPSAAARAFPGLGELAWLRRPTGGAALVHHHELTYALALPPGEPWQTGGESWLWRMHRIIRLALAELGVDSRLCEAEQKSGEVLCFLHHTPADLLVAGHKVVGSAQRKQRGAVLQHGGILLAQSPHTPQLPGIAELSGVSLSAGQVQTAVVAAVGRQLGWTVSPDDWDDGERAEMRRLLAGRYADPAWNERR